MPQRYECKFVTVEQGKKDKDYHEVIRENSLDGWRLVQYLRHRWRPVGKSQFLGSDIRTASLRLTKFR